MSKHATGPWRVSGKHVNGAVVIRGADLTSEIAVVLQNDNRYQAVDHARLIAAAPTGLDAAIFVYERLLSHPVDSWRIGPNGQQSLCALRDFIADATGQTEQEVHEFYEAKIAGKA